MKIIVDAMGGDNAPEAIVAGAVMAAEEFKTDIILVGKGEDILKALEKQGIKTLPKGVEIAHASQIVEMCDSPTGVLKQYPDSSMVVGLKLLAEGQGDAFVSAGNTGALLTAATLIVKRVKGIRRAALAPVIPTANGGTLLIDCGANVECTAEYLTQFAFMGSFYAEKVMGKTNARVGLLNNGSEESKGTPLQKEVYGLLKEASDAGKLNFTGNIEARDVPMGAVDVVVADGFTGNVLLKSIEGVGLYMAGEVKKIFKKNIITKLAALMVKSGLMDFKKSLDYNEVGGTMLLGISKPVIKAHGSCGAYAMRSSIRQAIEVTEAGIVDAIKDNIDKIKGVDA